MNLLSPSDIFNSVTNMGTKAVKSASRAVSNATSVFTSNNTDKAEISKEATYLSKTLGPTAMKGAMGLDADGDGQVTVVEIAAKLKEDIAAFHERVGEIFQENGISTDAEIDLSLDGSGKIVVDGNNAQKTEIENLLNGDSELRDMFSMIDANGSLLNSAQEAASFQSAYAANPQEAVNRYQYLFGEERAQKFMLGLSGANAVALVNGKELEL